MRSGMPESIRLTKVEQKQINSKCIELNKKLMSRDKMPIKESELVHILLEKSISCVRVDENGEIYIDA